MTTVSNEITGGPPVTNELVLEHDWSSGSAILAEGETLILVALPGGWAFEIGKRLKSLLLVELRTRSEGVLATTYLETEEYGSGDSEQAAISDLVVSLSEYMDSLEAREHKLGEPAARDLERLRALIEKS